MRDVPRTMQKSDSGQLVLQQMRHVLTVARGLLDQELHPFGITSAQLQVLHQIETAQNGLTGASLARLASVTPQTIQALLARSEREGWIRRGSDPDNQRLVRWSATPAGRRILVRGAEAFAALQARLWSGVSTAELHALGSLLERCLANLGEP